MKKRIAEATKTGEAATTSKDKPKTGSAAASSATPGKKGAAATSKDTAKTDSAKPATGAAAGKATAAAAATAAGKTTGAPPAGTPPATNPPAKAPTTANPPAAAVPAATNPPAKSATSATLTYEAEYNTVKRTPGWGKIGDGWGGEKDAYFSTGKDDHGDAGHKGNYTRYDPVTSASAGGAAGTQTTPGSKGVAGAQQATGKDKSGPPTGSSPDPGKTGAAAAPQGPPGSPPVVNVPRPSANDMGRDFVRDLFGNRDVSRDNQNFAREQEREHLKQEAIKNYEKLQEQAAKAMQDLDDLMDGGKRKEISAMRKQLSSLFDKNVDLTRRQDALSWDVAARKSDPQKWEDDLKKLDNEKAQVMKEIAAVEARLAQLGVTDY